MRLQCYKWIDMVVVFVGLVAIGLADILFGGVTVANFKSMLFGKGAAREGDIFTRYFSLGDLLIVCMQALGAVQMVYEQKYVAKYDVPPLLGVGFEGLFGLATLSVLIVSMHWIHVPVL